MQALSGKQGATRKLRSLCCATASGLGIAFAHERRANNQTSSHARTAKCQKHECLHPSKGWCAAAATPSLSLLIRVRSQYLDSKASKTLRTHRPALYILACWLLSMPERRVCIHEDLMQSDQLWENMAVCYCDAWSQENTRDSHSCISPRLPKLRLLAFKTLH